ncbi:MAG: hypothetical protein NC324_02355 [Bacteroides sp.]|nr:hypothetical protein [Bacteroides sp.]
MKRLLNKVRLLGFGLCCVCLLASCSPQQRLARLVNRHPCLVGDSIWHFSFPVPIGDVNASFRIPAKADTTFSLEDSASGVNVRVRLTDTDIDVQVNKPADTLHIDTAVAVPRINLPEGTDKAQYRERRRKQIVFAVCFCFGCVTVWFGSTIILKLIK